MNRSGEEQERLLALLEEEAQRTHSPKSHKDQREGLTLFNHQNSHSHLYKEGQSIKKISWSDKIFFCWFYIR